jgi:hypothetical protein
VVITTVLSSSKTLSVIFCLIDRPSGGVGERRAPLLGGALLRVLRENIAPARVRTFLFFKFDFRSGEVFALLRPYCTGTWGSVGIIKSIGSEFSAVGVCLGEVSGLLLPAPNQNLFLWAGLPELTSMPVESEAEWGRFGRPQLSNASSEKCLLGLTASAVFGRLVGLLSSRFGEGLDRVGGLLRDDTLPLREWVGRTVDVLPSVSEEIMERGRGITSTVSEKPTRGRLPV